MASKAEPLARAEQGSDAEQHEDRRGDAMHEAHRHACRNAFPHQHGGHVRDHHAEGRAGDDEHKVVILRDERDGRNLGLVAHLGEKEDDQGGREHAMPAEAGVALAGAGGTWLTSLVEPQILRWILGLSFIAMALWMLVPDKLDEGDTRLGRHGVFATTLIVFFLAEMGDKTQIATVALAAQYHDFMFVVAGTTLGMMIANVPAVLVGERIAARMP